ncbi:MAG: class IV adenylate cyclase [Acidobacteria bacterium]|nr:class IV adenylate cyclase [Acidobacteriota bacterium]
MGTEVEKKYRIGSDEAARLRGRLVTVGAERSGEEFEENTLYTGPGLEGRNRVLRLRRVNGGRAVFTFKESLADSSGIKHRREDETTVENPDALAAILDALGYTPAIVYEKRRETWLVAGVEVVVDELPFGMFIEIEGGEESILEAECLLELTATETEHKSYPQLTLEHGTGNGKIIEARFGGGHEDV